MRLNTNLVYYLHDRHPSVLFCLFKLLSWRSWSLSQLHAVRGGLHPRHVPLCLRGDRGRHTTTQFKAPVVLTGLWAVRGSQQLGEHANSTEKGPGQLEDLNLFVTVLMYMFGDKEGETLLTIKLSLVPAVS